MGKKILVIASNYGLWAEELQAPWDALKAAGHTLTLATMKGLTPLPMTISMDPDMIDPVQNYAVNPVEVVDSTRRLLTDGEWSNPIKTADAKMSDYDALVLVGGPGSPFDIVGNPYVHDLLLEAWTDKKVVGAICYAVGALAFTRDPDNGMKSIIWGRTVTAHPHAWDFVSEMSYELDGANGDNPGTDMVTQGFVFPLHYLVTDAVGPNGTVIADAGANREKPCFARDGLLVTALSVESSIAFGTELVEALR